MPPTEPGPKARQTAKIGATLNDEQRNFDLRLARDLVAFANGTPSSVFDWVPREQERILALGGHPRSKALPRFKSDDDDRMRGDAALALLLFGLRMRDNHASADRTAVEARAFLNEQLAEMQVVTFWRLNDRGEMDEISMPRLDHPRHCIAYVVGLMFLNRHDLRRGIKLCGAKIMAVSPVHFFMDLPNSKRVFCCEKHAATYRKRQQRLKERLAARAAKRKEGLRK